MAIKISQAGEKWRLAIIEEEWEFPSREKMEEELRRLLNMKETYGKVRKC